MASKESLIKQLEIIINQLQTEHHLKIKYKISQYLPNEAQKKLRSIRSSFYRRRQQFKQRVLNTVAKQNVRVFQQYFNFKLPKLSASISLEDLIRTYHRFKEATSQFFGRNWMNNVTLSGLSNEEYYEGEYGARAYKNANEFINSKLQHLPRAKRDKFIVVAGKELGLRQFKNNDANYGIRNSTGEEIQAIFAFLEKII